MRWHSRHRRRSGSFLLEAGVALVLLIAAAGTIAQFVSRTTRARQQQWKSFAQEMRLGSAVERLQQVSMEQLQATATDISDGDRYEPLNIEIRPIEVAGVSGQLVVVRSTTAEAGATGAQAELWRFDRRANASEATVEGSEATEEGTESTEEGDDE